VSALEPSLEFVQWNSDLEARDKIKSRKMKNCGTTQLAIFGKGKSDAPFLLCHILDKPDIFGNPVGTVCSGGTFVRDYAQWSEEEVDTCKDNLTYLYQALEYALYDAHYKCHLFGRTMAAESNTQDKLGTLHTDARNCLHQIEPAPGMVAKLHTDLR
jgi:hypothetical protein